MTSSPPDPESPEPTVKYIEPPRPEEADPDPIYTAPLFPEAAEPELNTMDPLLPAKPALSVTAIKWPLLVRLL